MVNLYNVDGTMNRHWLIPFHGTVSMIPRLAYLTSTEKSVSALTDIELCQEGQQKTLMHEPGTSNGNISGTSFTRWSKSSCIFIDYILTANHPDHAANATGTTIILRQARRKRGQRRGRIALVSAQSNAQILFSLFFLNIIFRVAGLGLEVS